jgi:hypothetical protein
MAGTKDLKVEALNFVRHTLAQASSNPPSVKAMKRAADRIVQALKPVVSDGKKSR